MTQPHVLSIRTINSAEVLLRRKWKIYGNKLSNLPVEDSIKTTGCLSI